jgi:WD40 repeat protein
LLWEVTDTNQGQRVAAVEAHVSVFQVAVRPDGTQVVAGGANNVAVVWDKGGQEVRKLPGHDKPVTAAAFDAAGKRLATASTDGIIKVWDAETFEVIAEPAGFEGEVRSLAFTADGKRLAAGGVKSVVKVWNLPAAP